MLKEKSTKHNRQKGFDGLQNKVSSCSGGGPMNAFTINFDVYFKAKDDINGLQPMLLRTLNSTPWHLTHTISFICAYHEFLNGQSWTTGCASGKAELGSVLLHVIGYLDRDVYLCIFDQSNSHTLHLHARHNILRVSHSISDESRPVINLEISSEDF